MRTQSKFNVSDPPREHLFSELDEVCLIKSVSAGLDRVIPRGAVGTVLGIWAQGAAYIVEFDDGLVTVKAHELAAKTARAISP